MRSAGSPLDLRGLVAAHGAALAVRPEDGRLLEALNGYLRGMRQARHALMFTYLSEEALSLIALARRD